MTLCVLIFVKRHEYVSVFILLLICIYPKLLTLSSVVNAYKAGQISLLLINQLCEKPMHWRTYVRVFKCVRPCKDTFKIDDTLGILENPIITTTVLLTRTLIFNLRPCNASMRQGTRPSLGQIMAGRLRNQNILIIIQEKAFEIGVCKMVDVFSTPQCVKSDASSIIHILNTFPVTGIKILLSFLTYTSFRFKRDDSDNKQILHWQK